MKGTNISAISTILVNDLNDLKMTFTVTSKTLIKLVSTLQEPYW